MQTVSKNYLIEKEASIYFQKFIANNEQEYGLRFGNYKDAKIISTIFKEIYDYNYAYPLVYDINHLRKELSKKDNFWFVGELINNKEIVGCGLLEKKKYIAHAGQAVVKKKFQGQGVTTKIGAAGIITVLKMPQFKDVLRVDSEVRASEIRSQKLIQYAGAIPYGLIPSYINYGDKRYLNIEDNKPFPPNQEESALLYSIILKNLWKKRENEVFLLNNEDIIFFYKYLKKISKKMKDDILILDNGKRSKDPELYGVSKDFYEGRVNLYGYIKEKSLKTLLKTYRDWRIIIWKIPTTKNGIPSMSVALDKGFKIVGYDIGSNNINRALFDSVILAFYPNKNFINLEINCLDETKPLAYKIKESFLPEKISI